MSSPSFHRLSFSLPSLSLLSQLDHRQIVLIDLLKATRCLSVFRGLSWWQNETPLSFIFQMMVWKVRQHLHFISYLHLQCVRMWVCVPGGWDCELIVSWIIYLFGVAGLPATFPFTALWFAYVFIYLKLYYISVALIYELSTLNQSK